MINRGKRGKRGIHSRSNAMNVKNHNSNFVLTATAFVRGSASRVFRVFRGNVFPFVLVLMFTSNALAQDAVSESRRTAIVRASERVAPAVVSVNVLRRVTVQPRSLWESLFL